MKADHFPTKDGMSYLEAKHLLLLNYCQTLVYYLLHKAKGFSIDGHPVVKSLVEIRLFLEKVCNVQLLECLIFLFYMLLSKSNLHLMSFKFIFYYGYWVGIH